MTTDCDLELDIGADQASPVRADFDIDFHEVRAGIAVLEYIRRGVELPGVHIDRDELLAAVDFALLSARVACERLGRKLRLLHEG